MEKLTYFCIVKFDDLNNMNYMNEKGKIVSFKTMKWLFDIILVILVATLVLLLLGSVLDIAGEKESVSGGAMVKGNKADTITLVGDTDSSISNVHSSLKPTGIEVKYEVTSEQYKGTLIVWKILYFLTLNLMMLFVIFVLFQIRNIIRSVYRAMGNEKTNITNCVFSHKNIRRLRYIAYGFIIMPFIELGNYYLDKYFLSHFIKIKDITISPLITMSDVSWDYILVGLLFIVLIEVFRRGIVLQEENDLTV